MTEAIDVLLITALKEELDAVLALGEGAVSPRWERVTDAAGFPYHLREFGRPAGGTFRIAAARATDIGKAAATEAASRLVTQLHPRCLAMCGICAGWQKKVSQGDVIVAERLYEWDKGKVRAFLDDRGQRRDEFLGDLTTYNLDRVWKQEAEDFPYDWSAELVKRRPPSLDGQRLWLLESLWRHESGEAESPAERSDRSLRCPNWEAVIEALQRERRVGTRPRLRLTGKGREFLRQQQVLHPAGLPLDRPFRVHVAPLASGDKVVEDREIFPQLAKWVRTVGGLEMEGAAIGLVAQAHRVPLMIVAKGVQDYADLTKDDTFREFASAASAAFLLSFLRHHLPPSLAALRPTIDQQVGQQRRAATPALREEVRVLAEEYEKLRATMPPGHERTRKMELVAAQMRSLALSAGTELLEELMSSNSPGERLAAITILQVRPEPKTLDWLADQVASEKPFGGYHAALALESAARAASLSSGVAGVSDVSNAVRKASTTVS